MKKIISIFMASLMFCISVSSPVLAGGVDKEETLDDGTKLIYISTEKIPEAIEKYAKKRQELLDARWTTKKIIAVKAAAVAAGIAGYNIPPKIAALSSKVSYGIQAVSIIAALIAFFYPDHVEQKLGVQYCGVDDRPGYPSYYWEDRSSRSEDEHKFGIGKIYNSLCGWYYRSPNTIYDGIPDEDRDSGIVIVLRPRSKWHVINTTISGVYSQKYVGSDEKGLLRGLKIEISKGK